MNTTWGAPVHEHDHRILTALLIQAAGAILPRTEHRERGCGHRGPAAVTVAFPPRALDDGLHRLRLHMLQPGPEAS